MKAKAKIKKMELQQAGEHKIVEVTLEKGGKEYSVTAKVADVLDEKRFASLLEYWTKKKIPEDETEAAMTDEDIEKKLVKIMTPKER